MVRLKLYSKNWSQFGDKPFKVESEYVPRAGEVIEAAGLLDMPSEEVTTFIVIEVTYEYTDGTLIPLVVAHQQILQEHGNRDARLMELRENGWLYPGPEN